MKPNSIKFLPALFAAGLLFFACKPVQYRTEVLLENDWEFRLDTASRWTNVEVPHDWAIYGPFDRSNDLQTIAVTQNLETLATEKTGRTGGLPYIGIGWYKRTLDLSSFDPQKERIHLLFDGAMSEPVVFVNEVEAIRWALGYNAFFADISPFLKKGKNTITVRLENRPFSSRWYPGAGLFRNVHLIHTSATHIPIWGVCVTTPEVSLDTALISIRTNIVTPSGRPVQVSTCITAPDGNSTIWENDLIPETDTAVIVQQGFLENPLLWSPETPSLYSAEITIKEDGKIVDRLSQKFGIRSIEIRPEQGFFLNGKQRKFRGVCNHHDLGPLGAAVNRKALEYQLQLLKEMGCDAVRTSHNMPAPELVDLCDSMGFMLMVEAFDEWDMAKCENGYHIFFEQWAEKDMVNMIRHYRNNPSVVMWSIGNEVPTQCSPEGYKVAAFLQNICHREDPTRPVTCGMDQVVCVLENGFASLLDVVGLNYRTFRYQEAYDLLPQKLVLGSETASTLSSRGIYYFPAKPQAGVLHPENQSSSYDVEHCWWSNIPDEDMALADDYPWTIGQFVWTGFDYLGEPTPYDTDAWPSHSSLFGIIDLASIPKDRYYYYRSQWQKDSATLHILPHWNWEGREGENIPVFVYTNYPAARLYLNGKDLGLKKKNKETLMQRYRLMWENVAYEPGCLRVVACDSLGCETGLEAVMETAGKPYAIELSTPHKLLIANGKDLAYVRVRAVDSNGRLCPLDTSMVKFEVSGKGKYRAAANGDPTCTDLFHLPQMPLFSGECTVIVQSANERGSIILKADAQGMESAKIEIKVQ